jgi:hypothetical protein
MYRSHVRYARICFDSGGKKSLDAPCNLSPMGSECSLPFTGRHPDSSSRHGSFKEHQSPHSSSSPVGCCPWRYKEDHRPTRSPEALPEAQFWFVARWRGSRHLSTLPRDTFIRGLPLCQRRSSTWRSRVACDVGSRSSRHFFPPTLATCPAPRLMAVWAVGHSRGHTVTAQAS